MVLVRRRRPWRAAFRRSRGHRACTRGIPRSLGRARVGWILGGARGQRAVGARDRECKDDGQRDGRCLHGLSRSLAKYHAPQCGARAHYLAATGTALVLAHVGRVCSNRDRLGSSESKPDEDDVDSGWDAEEDVDSGWGEGVDTTPEAAATPRRGPTAEDREGRAAHAAARKDRQRAKVAEKSQRRKERAAAASAKQKKQEKKLGRARSAAAPRATASDGAVQRRVEPARAAAGREATPDETLGAPVTATAARRRAVPPLVIIVLLILAAAGAIGLVVGRR
jgi:hypothetical protein